MNTTKYHCVFSSGPKDINSFSLKKESMNSFQNEEQRQGFYKTVRKMLGSIVAFSLIVGVIYLFGGFHKTKQQDIRCNAEKVVQYQGKQYLWDRDRRFGGGKLQSTDFAHSHQHSVKLDASNKFGLSYKIPAADGDEDLWISVWRYNPEGKQVGRLACKSGQYYEESGEVKERQDSGWEKLFIRAYIPLGSKNQPIDIFCIHEGEDPIYFDDLFIDFRREDKSK